MGFGGDFEALCGCVRERDPKSPTLGKLRVVLENMCEGGG
ncbi:unnamed protein product [Discosporangium mesarthrocarpum]